MEFLFEKMDGDESGTVSREELEACIGDLEELGLDEQTVRLAFELAAHNKDGDDEHELEVGSAQQGRRR